MKSIYKLYPFEYMLDFDKSWESKIIDKVSKQSPYRFYLVKDAKNIWEDIKSHQIEILIKKGT